MDLAGSGIENRSVRFFLASLGAAVGSVEEDIKSCCWLFSVAREK